MLKPFPPEPRFRSKKRQDQLDRYVGACVVEARQDTEALWIIRRARARIEALEKHRAFAKATLSMATRGKNEKIATRAKIEIERLTAEIEIVKAETGIRDA